MVKPLLDDLESWLNAQLPKISGKSELAKAIRHALTRMKKLRHYLDGGRLSSDGGVLLLRGIEKRLGLATRLAGCLTDARDPASTTHSYADMIINPFMVLRERVDDRGLNY